MPRTFRAAALAALLPALAAAQEPGRPSTGAGTSVTAGSGGYHQVAFYGDALFKARDLDPYAWAEFRADNFLSQGGVGGGVWKDLREDLRAKAGLGLLFGRFKDSDVSSSAVLFEAGIEKLLDRPTLGAEYRLTSGSLASPTALSASQEGVVRGVRGRAARAETPEPRHFSYNELSAYGKFPTGKVVPGLRVTLGLPSYERAIWDETVSLKIPVTKPLSVTPAVTFEEGPANNVFFTLSLYYVFD